MNIVPIVNDEGGSMGLNDKKIFFGLFDTNGVLILHFDSGIKRAVTMDIDEVWTDSSGLYSTSTAFCTATMTCSKFAGMNDYAGFDIIINENSVVHMEAVPGGTRITVDGFSSYPSYLETSVAFATVKSTMETKRNAEVNPL